MRNILVGLGYMLLFLALTVTGIGMTVGILWSLGVLSIESAIGGSVVVIVVMSAMVKGIRNGD